MAPTDQNTTSAPAVVDAAASPAPKKRCWRRWLRRIAILFVALLIVVVAARLAMPPFVRWYVNRTIDQNPLYQGSIGDIEIHLWRGAYSIRDLQLSKKTGNVPVPLFAAKLLDLHVQWDALLHGKLVGKVDIHDPELNFVDAPDDSQAQSGAGGPWLEMLRSLFPFKINSAEVHNGSIHLRAYQTNPPVDVFMSEMSASIENLTNVRDETTPLLATVKASALAMGQSRFEYQMKLDPFSYRPTFQVAVRLLGLDVTKVNQLTRAYGAFDFESGFFDLVVELNSKEGMVEGYVKPLFRNIRIFSLTQDMKEDNALEFFWEALVGTTTSILTNSRRDQFGTVIPIAGLVDKPEVDILSLIGNVLRNAFIRAYLPRLQGAAPDINGLEFGRASITEPTAVGDQ